MQQDSSKTPMSAKRTLRSRLIETYHTHEKYLPALFFIAGFVFDLLTLGRIDDYVNWLQQLAFLVIATSIVINLTRVHLSGENVLPQGILQRPTILYRTYRSDILHFLFGGLLSAFTIFYFKSSSLMASFSFLAVICFLLVANESKRFQALGLNLKWALLSLCWLSFSAIIVPTLIGMMGFLIFALSLIAGALPLVLVYHMVKKRSPDPKRMFSQIFSPLVVILFLFLTSYVLRIIPPVPLSVQHIGIYHQVNRTPEGYQLSFDKPWWKFWRKASQDFVAQAGDQIYVFFRLFAPSGFDDQVKVAWYFKDPDEGWRKSDEIKIKISGGRDLGFRGYAQKSNYQEGHWKVLVLTLDDREIGRTHFDVEMSQSTLGARNLQSEIH